MYRLSNVKIKEDLTEENVIDIALKKYNIKSSEVKDVYIYKKSIDARDKSNIYYNYAIDVELKKNREIKNASKVDRYTFDSIVVNRKSEYSPVIIGAGPAGLFTALILVENGICPIVIERGSNVEKRV